MRTCRLRSAAVSNEEISERIALEWMWYGRLLEPGELEKSLSEVTVRDVAAIARDFADGAYAVVSN